MSNLPSPTASVAIACGGTGGHLFPGLAIAGRLIERGCAVTLLVSPKEVDQEGVKGAKNMEVLTLPAVGLLGGNVFAFARGFFRSYRLALSHFQRSRPAAVLAMGGFTSAPPVLAARRIGARTFLHESNTIPGRANRWLSWAVDRAFVGFPSAAHRLHTDRVIVTGTPVRPQFEPRDSAACRAALGLDPARPVLLVMGGSQGARGINDLVLRALPLLVTQCPELQWFHLAGPADAPRLRQAYTALRISAVVHPFFSQMELALGAATLSVSRSGASSLAELAAMRVPAVLVPFPAATDDHQWHNARAFADTGAARLLEQSQATPETFAQLVIELLQDAPARRNMQAALARWHSPDAAETIAEAIFAGAASARSLELPSLAVQGTL